MKISTECPPIFEKCKEAFGVNWDSGMLITYGDTVYTKSGKITPDLIAHERTHIVQQEKIGVDEWWERYIKDPKFRLEQELEAYRNQANYARIHILNKKKRYLLMEHIWKSMDKFYGDMVTYEEAKKLIPF